MIKINHWTSYFAPVWRGVAAAGAVFGAVATPARGRGGHGLVREADLLDETHLGLEQHVF